jgi:hypothetical protein
MTPLTLYEKIKAGERFIRPSSMPPFYWDLIQACWAQKPSERPSFVQIVDLLRTDRRWVFDGTDDGELSAYEEKVLRDLPARPPDVPQFALSRPETADRSEILHTLPMDIGKLSFKLIDESDFAVGSEIRSASNGAYVRAERLSDRAIFGAKKIEVRTYFREIEGMERISHPAVVQLVGWRPMNTQNAHALVVTELCQEMSLFEVNEKCRRGENIVNWTPTKQSMAVIGIACAMRELHELNLMHGDLRGENVFLDANCEPRVAEFAKLRMMSADEPETWVDVSSFGSFFKDPIEFESQPLDDSIPEFYSG